MTSFGGFPTRAGVSGAPVVGALRRERLGTGALVLASLAIAAAVAACWPVWADMGRIWSSDSEQSQAFLVPVVVAWLVWVRRERLRLLRTGGAWWGSFLVLAGWGMNAAGMRWHVEAAWHLGALVMLVGAAVAALGADVLRKFFPALLSLCFLVPVPGVIRREIALPLQTHTASITAACLETLGADVERHGNMLRINQEDVLIAEACNGLRMVFALALVSYAFAYGNALKQWVRVLILVATPLTAIAFNVLRLVPVVWAFGNVSEGLATAVHELSGWIMLPCAFVALLALVRVLRWAQVPISPYVLAHGV